MYPFTVSDVTGSYSSDYAKLGTRNSLTEADLTTQKEIPSSSKKLKFRLGLKPFGCLKDLSIKISYLVIVKLAINGPKILGQILSPQTKFGLWASNYPIMKHRLS